jgi:hypothetical protein
VAARQRDMSTSAPLLEVSWKEVCVACVDCRPLLFAIFVIYVPLALLPAIHRVRP